MNSYFYFCTESPLIVTIDPSNVIAKVHQNVTFVCSAVGLGGFLFVWEHDGEVISAALSTLQQHSLTIHSVLPQHQGQYKCTVTSSYSNLTSEAFATLQLIGNLICAILTFIMYVCLIHSYSPIIRFACCSRTNKFQCISKYHNCFCTSN